MSKKISFNKYARACLDYVNKDRQNCIWNFKRENLPNPAKVFNLHAAEKISSEKVNHKEKVACLIRRVEAVSKCRGWKQRKWKRLKQSNFSSKRFCVARYVNIHTDGRYKKTETKAELIQRLMGCME